LAEGLRPSVSIVTLVPAATQNWADLMTESIYRRYAIVSSADLAEGVRKLDQQIGEA